MHSQEYWSGLSFPPPGDLPNPGVEPASPALASGFFTTAQPGAGAGQLLEWSRALISLLLQGDGVSLCPGPLRIGPGETGVVRIYVSFLNVSFPISVLQKLLPRDGNPLPRILHSWRGASGVDRDGLDLGKSCSELGQVYLLTEPGKTGEDKRRKERRGEACPGLVPVCQLPVLTPSNHKRGIWTCFTMTWNLALVD